MLGTTIVAILFLIVGGVAALAGYKLFRILLPILGLFVGFGAGFTAVEGIYGQNEIGFVTAVFIGLIVGLILALLSYAYFRTAIIAMGALVGAAVFTTVSQALSIGQEGFVTLMLGLSGAIIAGAIVANYRLDQNLVVLVSAMAGVALIMTGVFVLFSDLTLEELSDNGIATTFTEIVDSHIVWLFAWFGGIMASILAQGRTSMLEFMDDAYVVDEEY